MKRYTIFILSSLLFLITKPPPSSSWGPIGHSSIANIAQELLTTKANYQVSKLLEYKYNGNMSNAANWADEVRTLPYFKWSAPLHFINTPDWKCDYIKERDCWDSSEGKNFCVDEAIQNYTNRLKKYNDVDSLKFLIHFVGDIHQPLHCGFIGDRGGNDILGHFYDKKTNLHSVWDSGIIEKRLQTDFSYSPILWQDYIIKNVFPSIEKDKCINCSSLWGEESIVNACEYSYVDSNKNKIQDNFKLGDSYYKNVINIVEKQIAKASIRLANLLNFIYS
jgi:hypothetical protein